jgi:hypothetical protein
MRSNKLYSLKTEAGNIMPSGLFVKNYIDDSEAI